VKKEWKPIGDATLLALLSVRNHFHLAGAEKCKTGRAPIVARRAAGKGVQTAAHTATRTKKHMKMHDMASQHPAPSRGVGRQWQQRCHSAPPVAPLVCIDCMQKWHLMWQPSAIFVHREFYWTKIDPPHRPRSRFISWKEDIVRTPSCALKICKYLNFI
jgi:hypothetical protein